jgi:hypothetical protein
MTDQSLGDSDFLIDLQKFVTEKWKHNPCDRCGSFAWATLPDNTTILRLKAETPPNPHHSFSRHDVEFIPIYCENCGNTVNIYSQVFDEWRKSRSRTT